MRLFLTPLLSFYLLLFACTQEYRRAAPASEVVLPAVRFETAPEAPLPPQARKLIKTVNLILEVAATTAAADAIQRLAASSGGYVSSLSSDKRGELLHFNITIRVPIDRLDEVTAELKSLSTEVRRESIDTEDVTERFVDLEARLKTLRATEGELQALLAESRQRNQSAADIMAIYGHLTEIRTRIEQIQGQLELLDNQTSLSTIHIALVPAESSRPIIRGGWSPLETARTSVRVLIGSLQIIADMAIAGVIVVLPIAAILVLPVFAGVLAFRRFLRWRRDV
jgi:hypothetical protein